ncbi:PAS-domain containing protein [Kiloniella sp.]|uniref:PAS-domain containing protein n=1 Tax=Kiloniella sp. TaxID=1938587 RepID=UPI003B02B089
MLEKWQYKYGLSKLQVKLLTLIVPIFLLIGATFITAMEVSLYLQEKAKLHEKLEQVTQIFSVVMAEPLWNVEEERIKSILEAMAIDKDFAGATVYDDEGQSFGKIGIDIEAGTTSLTSQRPIIFVPEMESEHRVIGKLIITFTDKNLLAETYFRIATVVILAIVLILTLVATNIFAHQRYVGTPLRRMLALIQSSSSKVRGQRVQWSSDDEIGVVTNAFNQMLEVQERYHEELEIQVEARTQDLSEKSDLLQATLSNMRGGLVVFDAEGRMLTWNDRYFEIFNLPDRFRFVGLEFSELIKHDAEVCFYDRSLHHNCDVDTLIQRRMKSFAEGRTETEELYFTDGRIIEARRTPMPGGGQICSYIDITVRKLAEEQMVEKEAQLRAVLDNIPGGIRYVDKDRRYVFFNAQYCELYDFPDGLLKIGDTVRIENLYQAKRGDFGEGNPEALADTWIEKLPVLVTPQNWERKTIHGRVLEVHTTPTPSGGVINVVTDITKRKKAVEELRLAKESAELANRSKSDFLAAMSHELRTPLNAILGFSTMIKDQMLGPKKEAVYAEYGADIFNSGRHLLRLINDLLDLSKIEAGKLELDVSVLDVRKSIQDNLRTIDPLAKRSDVIIETDIEDNLPLLKADQRAFDQIILNLLSNAIKFTPEGGCVTVRASNEDTSTKLVIADTGIGIEQEYLEKIMKPWGQIIDPLRIDIKGSGLGLPIVKSLVELHCGTISLESEVGIGTTITVLLPNAGPPPQT